MDSSSIINQTTESPGNSTGSSKANAPFAYDKVFNEPVFISIYVFIFVPTVICNSLVCWIVKNNSSMHTNTNFLLVNLAVADMLAAVLSIFHMVDYLAIDLHLGDIACKFRSSLVYICHGASVFTLTAIAHERYYAICQPLTIQLRQISIKWIIPQTWLLAIFIHIPPMIFCGTQVSKYKQSSCSCYELFPSHTIAKVYAISKYMIVYIFPVVIVISRYFVIVRRLRQQSSSDNESGFTSQETKKRVVKMLIASSAFFFLAWTPFYTSYLLRDTGVDKRSVYSFVWYLSMLLALCNCAYNPVIYCLLSKNFRQGFNAVLCWCYRRQRSVSPLRTEHNLNHFVLPIVRGKVSS